MIYIDEEAGSSGAVKGLPGYTGVAPRACVSSCFPEPRCHHPAHHWACTQETQLHLSWQRRAPICPCVPHTTTQSCLPQRPPVSAQPRAGMRKGHGTVSWETLGGRPHPAPKPRQQTEERGPVNSREASRKRKMPRVRRLSHCWCS